MALAAANGRPALTPYSAKQRPCSPWRLTRERMRSAGLAVLVGFEAEKAKADR